MTEKLLWPPVDRKMNWRWIRVDLKNGDYHEFNADEVKSVTYKEDQQND